MPRAHRAAQVEAELAVARAKAADDAAMIAHQKLADRQAEAPALRAALGAHGAPARSDGAGARGAGERPPRTRSPPSARPRRRRRSPPSPASGPPASRSPRICRASGWSCRAPTACACCGGARLRKLGENITETLEVIPRQWKVIQHVREKLTCRDCEKISEAPAPFHVTPRGWAGPNLLAMLLFEKFGQHQPLNRQAERYAREGVPLSLSTLADQVGAGCAVLEPLLRRIEATSSPPSGCTATTLPCRCWPRARPITGRCWVYVRDDRPFGGPAPPAAMFYYSRDRGGEHPVRISPYAGHAAGRRLGGYSKLYEADRHRGRSWRPPAGRMRAGRSSRWPISRPVPVARPRARRRRRSRRWRWRRSGASTRCSRSSAPSTARAPSERRRGSPGI